MAHRRVFVFVMSLLFGAMTSIALAWDCPMQHTNASRTLGKMILVTGDDRTSSDVSSSGYQNHFQLMSKLK